jgi:aryl-alcohol dehydrogenase-like predicted oxidoreductase
MEYRNFGRTGVKVSPLILGTMNFGKPTSRDDSLAIIERAVDAGINVLDTANIYNNGESESIVGQAIKHMRNRAAIILATKVYNAMGKGPNDQGVSRHHIMTACEDSLRRLGVDYIDLYQLHRPSFTVPQDETLRAFDDLIRQGKVRYIGTSTFPAWKLMEALAVSERYGLARYVSDQSPYNLLDRRIETELVPLAKAHDLALITWSPMAGGMLSGKYPVDGSIPTGSRGDNAPRHWRERLSDMGRIVAARLNERAQARGMSAAQFALLWVKDQPGITAPIFGPRTMEQLETALPVMDWKLEAEDASFCDDLVPPGSAVADFFNTSGWMKGRVG